jgi:hypothetical protein
VLGVHLPKTERARQEDRDQGRVRRTCRGGAECHPAAVGRGEARRSDPRRGLRKSALSVNLRQPAPTWPNQGAP